MRGLYAGACAGLTVLALALNSLAQTISITGTVTNNHGTPLGGASVKLLGAGRAAGTDSEGNFALQSASTRVPLGGTKQNSQRAIRLNGSQLRLDLTQPVRLATVSVHDLAGRKFSRSEYRNLAPGVHSLSCAHYSSQQAFVVNVSLDHADFTFRSIGGNSARRTTKDATAGSTEMQKSLAVVDTLRVEMGGIRKDTVIESYQASGLDIVLDYEIPTVPPLPDKSMAEQNAAKQFFEGLGADFVGFRHKDHDPAKDVIGFAISTQNSGTGVMDDRDIERLLDFPKLQSVWIQNQNLSDEGVAVLAKFPDLIEARFHYMATSGNVSPDFVVPMNVHRNMRVFEVKHCFGMNTINVGKLDGFPHIVRIVLDNGAATDQGAEFLAKCPNLKYLQFHRGTMSQESFDMAMAALPNLEVLWARSKRPVGPDGLAVFKDHPSLKGIRLISQHAEAMETYPDFLMPLASIPTFETFYGGYQLTEPYPESLKRLQAAREDIEITRKSGDIDYGFVFIPRSSLNTNSAKAVEATLP